MYEQADLEKIKILGGIICCAYFSDGRIFFSDIPEVHFEDFKRPGGIAVEAD